MFRKKRKHKEYVIKSIFEMRTKIVTGVLLLSKETNKKARQNLQKALITRGNLYRKYTKRHKLINF